MSDDVVLEDPSGANVALDVDREYVVISAKAVTVDQLLEICWFCGVLQDSKKQ